VAKPGKTVIAAAVPGEAARGVVVLGADPLRLDDFTAVCAGAELRLGSGALARMARGERMLAESLASGVTVYGVTTAYGADSARKIDPRDRAAFQLATLRSHACGTGTPLSWEHARGVWFAKAGSMATGLTGATPALVEMMVRLLNAGFAPVVPSSGSLGASGDLIPSAHAALPLVSEGEVLTRDGTRISAPAALAAAGLTPVRLGPRDGLSLVNGTAVTASLAAHAAAVAARLIQVAGALAAAGLETLSGHPDAFSAEITHARPHPEAHMVAAGVRDWLAGADPQRLGLHGVHDPYAWRCVPQVHGAAASAFGWAAGTCLTELASCTDNPVVTADGGIVSGGNFHAAPLGIPMDAVRLGIGEVAALSRQRITHLGRRLPHLGAGDTNGNVNVDSGRLPAQTTGLTMVLTTATAAVLEIGSLGPATGRWLPVDDMEDHVSNATVAARFALTALDLAWTALAAEAISIVVCIQRAGLPARSAGARWLLRLLAELGIEPDAVRLNHPLADTLETLRCGLAAAEYAPPPDAAVPAS
jgi:histidine ammonia-lyase